MNRQLKFALSALSFLMIICFSTLAFAADAAELAQGLANNYGLIARRRLRIGLAALGGIGQLRGRLALTASPQPGATVRSAARYSPRADRVVSSSTR
jgi:hypothetical protein